MKSLDAAFEKLPRPILEKLESMVRRVRRLLFLRGAFATLATALASILVIMAIDASVTLFSPAARWALSLTGLGVTLLSAWWFLFRPLSRRLTLTRMARILEIRHPELQERISTAVELLSSDDPDSIKGSSELIGAVVESAVADVGTVDPLTEFRPVQSKKFIRGAGALAACVVLVLVIWPQQSWILLTRAVAPFLDVGNAYADTLVIDPGDVRIAKGDPLVVTMSLENAKLRRAELRTLLEDGSESVERMTLLEDGSEDGRRRFEINFPRVEEGFPYRIRAGSALSRYFDVTVVDPPVVETLTIRYDYPDYTGLSAVESESETGEIRAVVHTRVTVRAKTNKEVESAVLFINQTANIGEAKIEGGEYVWQFVLDHGHSGSWHLDLADAEGFAGAPFSHPIEVLPDKAPTVQITQPLLREMKVRPTEQLPILGAIIEDFGVRDVALIVTPDGSVDPMEVPQAPAVPGERSETYHATTTLNLPALKLAPAQRRLAVQMRVRDNRPSEYDGPGTGLSETIFIQLDERAKSLADQLIEEQRRDVEQSLREAKRELERARDDLRQTGQELEKSDTVNERARKELDEFSERSESARDHLDRVAAQLNRTLFQEQADEARRIADETIAAAREQADLIPVTDDPGERRKDADEAREQVEEAIRDVDQLAQTMRSAEDDYRAISRLNELANRQQELASRTEDLAEQARQAQAEASADEEAARRRARQDKQEMDRFKKDQNRVQQQLADMLKDNAAALGEILEGQQEEALAMAQEAAALAAQQEELRRITEEATQAQAGESQDLLKEAIINQLEARQRAIAGEAARKAESPEPEGMAETDALAAAEPSNEAETEETPRSASESLAEAADEAAAAADRLGQRELDAASEAAGEAGQSLAEAATAEGEKPNEKLSSSPSAADASPAADPASPTTGELAKRQEALASQIDALKDGRVQEALSLLEAQLESEAAALQAGARDFQETLKNLAQGDAQSSAGEAGKALGEGAKKAQDSSRRLDEAQAQQSRAEEQGQIAEGEMAEAASQRMEQAGGPQQQSAESLRQAAEALGETAGTIGQTREGLEPSDSDDRITEGGDLAKSFDEVSDSSRSQNTEEAAQQSQQAADSLQQLARAAMEKLGSPDASPSRGQDGEPPLPSDLAGDPNSDNLNETGEKSADAFDRSVPRELEQLGISAEDWARFRGALSAGNAAAVETELPMEYRELIGRYFQVIAKEAGK